jgi:predicted PurR-regulated permease PerM
MATPATDLHPPPPDPVPGQLRLAASIAWRVLVVAAALALIAIVISRLRIVVLPVVFALFLAAALAVPVERMRRARVPAGIAAALALVTSILVIAALVAAIAPSVADELGDVGTNVREGTAQVTDWLLEGPLDLSRRDLDRYRERGERELRQHTGDIAGGVIGGAYIAVEVIAGLFLTLVITFFFLKDGERLWGWAVNLFPPRARGRVDDVGRIAWVTLGGYLRGVVVVAFVDAFFIGIALWLIGVPLIVPLVLLTFIGGFFPIVGAVTAGAVATLVALVSGGLTDALLVLAATIAVQQLESHLLQPIVMSRAVKMHPVAVLVSVAAGAVLWGVVGAFLAVPVVAVISRSASHLRSGPDEALLPPEPAPRPGTDPDAAPPGTDPSGP